MPITLGTNIASLSATRRLDQSTNKLSSVYERLSSGQRINRAADDAAGLAISSSLNGKQRVFSQAIRNVNDGVSALNIADQAIANLSSIVIRQQELAEQAANGIYTTAQRNALDLEAQTLSLEYQRILSTTEFNGRKLLDGSITGISLQAGYGANGAISAQYFTQGAGTAGGTIDNGTTSNSTITFGASGGDVLATGFLFGDLNNDGRQDIVAISAGGSSAANNLDYFVEVFLGKASGGYSAADATASESFSLPGNLQSALISGALVDSGADGDLDIRLQLRAIDDTLGLTTYEQEQLVNNTVQNGGVFSLVTTFGANSTSSGAALSNGGTSIRDLNGDGFNDDVVNNGDGTFTIRIHNTTTTSGTAGTIDDLAQTSFSLTSQSNARSAITSLDTLSTELAQTRGKIGASLSRISAATAVLQTTVTNFAAAEGRIKDADTADETSNLVRLKIMQQTASAVISQANLIPEIALKLLRS